MAILYTRIVFLLFVFFLSSSAFASFSPADEYLVNCGSDVDSTVDNRRFVGDASASKVKFLSSEGSIALKGENLAPTVPQIYRTARIFAQQAKYKFNVREQGTHMVRLHFNRLYSSKIDLNDALFHVTVNGHVVLRNFSGDDKDSSSDFESRVREFLIWVDVGEVVIRFVPSKDSNFAFVNAIEVISAPKDLIGDVATSVSHDGTEKFNGLATQAMEVVYRINVGGRKVTPFNDTLWRTWVTDDEFFKTGDGSSEKTYFTGRIKYRPGGASREVGPDNVYNTARVGKRSNGLVDMSWDFKVSSGYKYLIRMHFCDIASKSLGRLYFNVYINGNLAYQDFDISYAADDVLASPYYIDFVVDATADTNNPLGSTITVSVGPSNKTNVDEHGVDAILNGVEIMKMNNSMGSLDGYVSTEMILSSCPNRRNLSIFIAMLAFMCIFMSFYIVTQRKKVKDQYGWTKLSMDILEDNPKSGNQFAARKA
ncbi:probable receptor-like protein kinase At5g24010 [Arabidopsis lyrata subsp. lyrata]|uniref:probable receptor-like protein kinase At5g24010 n=1 Tax=Arabidopsis lyrata subsp. lyrata TaxID=81972 RepID=UPI000A29B3D7|nr:probable receptor-like protein kinase At5g24010 [Arabidopsis lyrata subsp. lyrata]|eukprot:XP_020877836.1 probable receptor-like protein kinase At5g24010 [Arabidopsis lyrata subsp. lyrata]